jgi:hypothetical protein
MYENKNGLIVDMQINNECGNATVRQIATTKEVKFIYDMEEYIKERLIKAITDNLNRSIPDEMRYDVIDINKIKIKIQVKIPNKD